MSEAGGGWGAVVFCEGGVVSPAIKAVEKESEIIKINKCFIKVLPRYEMVPGEDCPSPLISHKALYRIKSKVRGYYKEKS